jgi:hypothetical protein
MGARFVAAHNASCALQESAIAAGVDACAERKRRHAVDAACKKLAGREPPKVHTRIEGSWVEPPQECKNSCGAQHWDDAVGCNKCGTTWARYARAPKLGRLVPPRPLPPTPVPVSTPAIGEVVSWEVAKADMQARPEARYRMHMNNHLYRVADGVVMGSEEGRGAWEQAPANHSLARCRFVRES